MHCESRAPNEFPHLARRWRPQLNHPYSFILEELVHGVIQRNTTQVQINCKLTISVYTNFRDRIQDKSFNLTTGAAHFK